MSSDDDGSVVVGARLNPQLCARLRQKPEPQPASACSPPRRSLKRLVGNAVVQRIRQQNHQLALEEFLGQPEPAPKVSQEDALNYFARRAYNSLCSREMLAKEAKEASQLRREPFTQMLAKDISRRHFRTAKRYDTGSKYHPPPADGDRNGGAGGERGLHDREAREPLLTLLRSRKLVAVADVLLAHPGSVRVGPQPMSPGADEDNHAYADDAAAAAGRDGSSSGRGGMAPPEDRDGGGNAVVSELVVPSLDATRYALALFSPRRGGRAAGDAPTDAAPAGRGAPRHGLGDGAAAGQPPSRQRLPDVDEDAASATTETTSADGQRSRSVEGSRHPRAAGRGTASRARSAGEAAEAAPPAPEAGEDLHPAGTAAGGAMDSAARSRERRCQEAGRGSEEHRGSRPAAAVSCAADADAAAPAPSSSPPARPEPAGSEAVTVLQCGGGAGHLGEAMPPRVQHRLMGDKLRELLAASRGLFAQAEGLLGEESPRRPPDGGPDDAAALSEDGGALRV
ncbi:hypothetical protein PLESTB_000026800 [Pleodorina starrii]|uniref:Uncharacterized protein n=1 Tax=Pleodorina starrii TaxID=330485 RepID=A0A9W6B9T1_9CHLO|nr:hypothetical protein PLESTM_001107800 [Pleodorina starrii]GLC47798.1 hypothetical protein PLESTB_000026800 [Pleodorina starrii]